MKIKKIILLALIACFIEHTSAQNFVLGASDASEDASQPSSPDAKSIYYAVNENTDSLWFKLVFYNRIDNISWNIKVGLDSNNQLDDGGTWAGLNKSMKYDLMLDIYNHPGFPPVLGNILNGNGQYLSSNISISVQDTNSIILRLKLSDVKQKGSVLNFIAGTGIVLGSVNDDIPNSGYQTIPAKSSGIENSGWSGFISIYPNPTNNLLSIASADDFLKTDLMYVVVDLTGSVLLSGKVSSTNHTIDISELKTGTYLIKINGSDFSFVKKVAKI